MSKPVNVSVELSGKIRNSHQLIRKFIRLCKEEGIVREYKESLKFETKGQKRRRKKHEGKRRAKRRLEEEALKKPRQKKRKRNK